MKIDVSDGAPIWVSPRKGNGVTLIQGKSHLLLSAKEIPDLLQAVQKVSAVALPDFKDGPEER
jgi:hypothetical protein